MRLLFLTFYFRPDLSAGSFRATALIEALRARLAPGDHIDVVTTEPNRYSSFAAGAGGDESSPGLAIHRVKLPAHQSDMRGQARAFLTFARGVRRFIRQRDYDLVYATSSRLMTASIGAAVARRRRCPLYLDIRDLFVDTIGDILPGASAPLARLVFSRLERRAFGQAETINLVSRGFESYVAARYPRTRLSWFTNGVDEEFIAAAPVAPQAPASGTRLRILYAGNLGEGQGLHAILPAVAARLAGRAEIVVIGDGGRREQLRVALASAGVTNVQLRPPIKRDQLIAEYQAADVLFLHLNDHAAFERVLPSKIFEFAAMGKPIWAGVAGCAARFLESEVSNSAVFAPCDADAAMRAFERLRMVTEPRPDFIDRHGRPFIMGRMAEDVLGTLARARSR